jgi:hypothetical protein
MHDPGLRVAIEGARSAEAKPATAEGPAAFVIWPGALAVELTAMRA